MTQTSDGNFTGDLRDLLVPRPAGTKPWEDFVSPDGNLTADQAADLFQDEAAMKEDLESMDFRRGAVNHWSREGE